MNKLLPSNFLGVRPLEDEIVNPSSIVENSPHLISALRIGGSFEYINPAMSEVSGYSKEDLYNNGLPLLLGENDYQKLKHEYLPKIVKNKKYTYELPFILKTGEVRYMSVTAFMPEENGEIVFSIATDITHLKNMQIELEQTAANLAMQTAMLSSMFSSLPDLVYAKNLDLKYTHSNKNFESYFGIEIDDIYGKNQAEVFAVNEDDAEKLREVERKVIKEKITIRREEEIPSLSGEIRLFEATRTPLLRDGEPIGIMSIARDITERNKMEQSFKMTLDNIDAFIYASDAETGEILFANKRLLNEYGKINYNGKKCWEVVQKNRKERCEFCPVPILMRNEGNYENGYVWERHSAITGKYYRSTDNLIRWHDGRLVHLQNSVDISDMKLMETALVAAKEQAEQGSSAKGNFLSHMSHEIRTPLNAIIGMIRIALNSSSEERIFDCLNKADSASKHLLGVINNVLDMSKIEAGKFELDNREFNFEKMLKTVTNVINYRTEEKNQNFIVNLNENVPESIVGDDLRLSQVVANFLTNAVKFTPEHGTITLNIDKIDEDDAEVTLKISVEDTGIGISEEQQKRLFSSFEQADSGISRKFGGTGLGLLISKNIIELMNGKVWIESMLGKGSKFIFTIKAGKGREKKCPNLAEKIVKENLRILAVDDSQDIREFFTYVMKSLKLKCDVAESGKEALEMIKNNKEQPYNIFFVDLSMPEMNGIELTKKIKESVPENSFVFMISSAKWNTIRKEATTAGVEAFIPKPLYPSTLVNAIYECIEVKTRKLNFEEAHQELNFAEHTILIAEDVDINREIMSAILEETNINIDYAENGVEAVEMFEVAPHKYSLIMMDIQMPRMDGYEATKRIRSIGIPRAKEIPIIAMTANVFREDVEKCLAVGMNGHIGKPVDQDDVLDKLKQFMPATPPKIQID